MLWLVADAVPTPSGFQWVSCIIDRLSACITFAKRYNGYRVVPAGGTTELRTAGGIDDTTGASWEASQEAGRLLFAADLPSGISLDGTFLILIDLGEIQVDEALTTSGRLRMWAGLLDLNENLTMGDSVRQTYMEMTGGKIVVAPGKKFEHK